MDNKEIKCCNLECDKKATYSNHDKKDKLNTSYFCDEHIKDYGNDIYANYKID